MEAAYVSYSQPQGSVDKVDTISYKAVWKRGMTFAFSQLGIKKG